MILNFRYLDYMVDSDHYIERSASLFNKKELNLIKETSVVNEVESGDVVYRGYDFYTKLGIGQRDLKDYYTNLVAQHGIVLSNALSPDKCTLFVETDNTVSLFSLLKHNLSRLEEEDIVYYRKIPVQSLRIRFSEDPSFVINMQGIDYTCTDISYFENEYVENGFFYIKKTPDEKCAPFQDEVLLKAYTLDENSGFYALPALLLQLEKSKYNPKIISANNFVASVKKLKKLISYNEYVQMKSLIGTKYEDSLASLLTKYDIALIERSSTTDPASYIYHRILVKEINPGGSKIKSAIESAYTKGDFNVIQEYLSVLNASTSNTNPIIDFGPNVKFIPVNYYIWEKPNDFFKDLNFKEYKETEEIE